MFFCHLRTTLRTAPSRRVGVDFDRSQVFQEFGFTNVVDQGLSVQSRRKQFPPPPLFVTTVRRLPRFWFVDFKTRVEGRERSSFPVQTCPSMWSWIVGAVIGVIAASAISQKFLRARDEDTCHSFLHRNVASEVLHTLVTRQGKTVVYYYARASTSASHAAAANSQRTPVCIPGGLAATMATTGALQDELQRRGFDVLAFDRVGVGLSDEENRTVPSVDDCVDEMHAVMQHADPSVSKWILLGPSMGSIVAQCYMLQYPERVAAFLNLDGLPHAFYLRREKFLKWTRMYRVFSALATFTPLVRLMVWHLSRTMFPKFVSKTFPVRLMAAQMNLPRFWEHVVVEMPLMMDLAEAASHRGWGSVSVVSGLDQAQMLKLSNLRPAQCGTFGAGQWTALPRSKAEHGTDWTDASEAAQLVHELRAAAAKTALGRCFANIPVRVLSARSFDYPGGDSFYDAEMKQWIGAEHALHAVVGAPGSARYVLPQVGHDKLFLEIEVIGTCLEELRRLLQ